MKEIICNEIELDYPESFYFMEEDEMKKYFSSARNRKGFRNEQQKMIISVGWSNPLNVFTSLFVNPHSFLDLYNKQNRSALKSYSRMEDISKEICGLDASGFAFSYEASDTGVKQNGKVVTVKIGKRIYLVEYTTSSTDRLFCNMAFDMVISSMKHLMEKKL